MLKVVLFATLLVLAGVAWSAEPPAKELFGGMLEPGGAEAAAIGSYARGCLAGAVPLAKNGVGWQAMRLSRNRHWGHPALVAFVETLADELRVYGHSGLLVGDMAQPRGGPMLTGHASHQIGLDVDIWFKPMPPKRLDAAARETLSAASLLRAGTRELDEERFRAFDVTRVVRTAATASEVARIFVHPTIKRGLCQTADGDRGWLRKVRPWWGHHYHFHVRLACPAGAASCVDQTPPPPGDGCGAELDWWFTDEPWRPSTSAPSPPLRLADLPSRCVRLVEGP